MNFSVSELFSAYPALFAAALLALICVFALRRVIRILLRPKIPSRISVKVVYVCDGDSIWGRTWMGFGPKHKFRLLGIDAPESEQEYGRESQALLERLVLGKRIEACVLGEDIYGRLVATVFYNGEDVCLRMIREGAAWPYFRFFRELARDQAAVYRLSYEAARSAGRGLWRNPKPEAPWDWRRRHRTLWERFLLWLRRVLGLL